MSSELLHRHLVVGDGELQLVVDGEVVLLARRYGGEFPSFEEHHHADAVDASCQVVVEAVVGLRLSVVLHGVEDLVLGERPSRRHEGALLEVDAVFSQLVHRHEVIRAFGEIDRRHVLRVPVCEVDGPHRVGGVRPRRLALEVVSPQFQSHDVAAARYAVGEAQVDGHPPVLSLSFRLLPVGHPHEVLAEHLHGAEVDFPGLEELLHQELPSFERLYAVAVEAERLCVFVLLRPFGGSLQLACLRPCEVCEDAVGRVAEAGQLVLVLTHEVHHVALAPFVPEEPHAVVVPRVAYHDGVDLASAAVGLDHDGEFPSLLDVELVAQFGGHVHDGDPAFEFAVGDEFVGHCQGVFC